MSVFTKDSPGLGDVHVPTASKDQPSRARRPRDKTGAEITKAAPEPLYVYRRLLNPEPVIAWAKAQGFKTTLPADNLHTTIIRSRDAVDWMAMGESWSGDKDGHVTVSPGGPRVLDRFGPEGEVGVLLFSCDTFSWRNSVMREKGASSDWQEYQPHLSISFDIGDADLSAMEPYQGELVFGPEIFQAIEDDWSDQIVEKAQGHLTFCKFAAVNDELGIVFGWAMVCKIAGKDYYDRNMEKRNGKWENVPEHIPEAAMLKSGADFAKSARPGNEMHDGPDSGQFAFLMPWTAEIAKAYGYEGVPPVTGLMVGYYAEPAVLAKYKNGTYKGFSIEGSRVRSEELA